MRNRVTSFLIGALIGAMFVQPLQAQDPLTGGIGSVLMGLFGKFFGAGGATEFTQKLNNMELVAMYANMGEQLATEIKQLADMVKNSTNTNGWAYGRVSADLNELAAIVQQGQAISYATADADRIFRTRFPGYTPTGPAYYKQYRVWNTTALDTVTGLLGAAARTQQQLQYEQGVIANLRDLASGATGRMASLQVNNMIAEQSVEQLNKLRAMMAADAASKQVYYGYVLQKDAVQAATTEDFFHFETQPEKGNKGY